MFAAETTMNAFMRALSIPSQVSLAELWWQFYFFFPFSPLLHSPSTPPSLPLKLMKRNDQKCSETNGEPLFWSFDLWDWKVLHKEQMMTVPTVVLYIIIIPYQLFLFKAATCAACPYLVPAAAHGEEGKRKKKAKERVSLCLVTWSAHADGSN